MTGICQFHGRYQDVTAPGCPECAKQPHRVYMGGMIRHPDEEPDAADPCPSCASLRAELAASGVKAAELHERLAEARNLVAALKDPKDHLAWQEARKALVARAEAAEAECARARPFTKQWREVVWNPLTKLLADNGYVQQGGSTFVEMATRIIAERDAALSRVRSLAALLGEVRPFIATYAEENPRWQDSDGDIQDPSGVHALLSRIDAALKGGVS